jgi:hypothetical protein
VCPDCKIKYIGQIDRPFRTRFSEHFKDFKYASQKSHFAQRLLENGHSIGPIENIMEIIYPTTKGRQMDTIEKFHMYKITCEGTQINDKNTSKPNAIYDAIIRKETARGHTERETPM